MKCYVLLLSVLFLATHVRGQVLNVPQSANEGADVTITYREVPDMSAFSDEVTINFGDGTIVTNYAFGRTALLTLHHVYRDDSRFTNYIVTVTEEDYELGATETSREIFVANVPPRPLLAAEYSVPAGRFSAMIGLDDPGSDNLTVQVFFGDGSIQNFSNFSPGNLLLNHTYNAISNYTLTVTVRDDEGGLNSASAPVRVTGLAPAPTLSIYSFAGVLITGELGRSYDIQKTDSAESTNWTTVAIVTLSTNPQLWMDMDSTNSMKRLYRAIAR